MVLRCIVTLHFIILLSACSVAQTVSDAAGNAYRSWFPKKQETLSINIAADQMINLDVTGKPLVVTLRFYQLRGREAFERASYDILLHQDKAALAHDMLSVDSHMVVPDSVSNLNIPLSQEAQFLGVVAFFRRTDGASTWRFVVDRNTLLSLPNPKLSMTQYTIRMQGQALH